MWRSIAASRGGMRLNLAPTASTTTMLALGDALAIAVSLRKGFRAEDFADLHPGGKLGKRLAKRARPDALRRCAAAGGTDDTDDRRDYEMSSKKLGVTTVQEERSCAA
jgi:arabinose-5-phosphate isomerase